MLIDRSELYYVAVPLIDPWRTAYGADTAVLSDTSWPQAGQAR